MAGTAHLQSAQFHKATRVRRLSKSNKGWARETHFSHRKSLVGFRPETRLGAKHAHPGGLKPPGTKMRKPGTFVLHAPKPRVYHNGK